MDLANWRKYSLDCAKYNLAGEVSWIYVVFQYGKQGADFIFAYCYFFTFEK